MAEVPDRDIRVKEPSLIEHVRNILLRYPEGGQILKELIQNADDAGATEIKFMIDPRRHGNDNLWLPGLANFQGPALLAWNNAKFSENDWESVFHIYQSLKKKDPMKVGRFGLGFVSVYHITDLPFILSDDTIAVFDPCRKNINVRDKDGSPKTGHWLYLKDFRKHAGSVRCFENLFGFSSQQDKYPGTIFRFPLRNRASDISNVLCSCREVIEKLYKSLVEEAPYMLLFLKNISRISLYTYNEQKGHERLAYEIMVDCAHVVQSGRTMCQEKAKSWEIRTDIFCHLNSLSVSFKNNLLTTIPGEGTYHWLVMNCIAGKNCEQLESLSKNLNVIPWAGVAAQLPVHINLTENFSVSLTGGHLDIGNMYVSAMLDSLSRCKISIPWVLDKPPNLPGHAFCFLPLPSNIGLPVFIHGYFSVADNRRSIKWPSHDEHGEEALFNQALVNNLVIPTYAFLLACRSSLIAYKEMPLLYENPHNMLEPYCIWPLLSQDGQPVYSMWSTLVEPVIRLLVNHNLPVAWTSAGGGRKTSLLSAFYLPGTFTKVNRNLPNAVIEVLTVLDKPLVILPAKVAQIIVGIEDIKQKMFSREMSPSMIRSILKEQGAINKMTSVLLDKQKCSAILEYVLSNLSESSCHELQSLCLLPVEKLDELPKPFTKQHGDCLYIVDDKQCTSFLLGVTDQLTWSGLSYNVLQQLKRVVGYKQYQLKIADAVTVCTELLPNSMNKWTNCNGGQVQWKPGTRLHPPLQWLDDVWNWLNKMPLDVNSINNLSIMPLDLTASPVNLIPLSFSGKCFLMPKFSSALTSNFIPEFLKSLGFTIVCETPIVFAQSQIKEKFNPISPDSIIKVLTNSTISISSIIESIKSQSYSDKTKFLSYIAQLTRSTLSSQEVQVVRQLPLFKPIGSNQLVPLNDRAWILLTNGVQLLPNLQYPPNIIGYSTPEERRFLQLLGCVQPTFTQLCTDHVIPFALSSAISNVTNTHNLMRWILRHHIDASLMNHLISCKFVPRGRSGELVKPCDLFDPEDPQFSKLFDQHEDCIPSDLYRDYLPVLRKLGLQTWYTVSSDEAKLNPFLIDRAKSVSALCANNYMKAFEKSVMIVHLLKSSPKSIMALSVKLSNIPFLFCQNQRPGDYPKSLKWHGEGIKTPFPPWKLYPVHYKLLIGSIGPVIHEWYGLDSQILFAMLKTPYISELSSQLTTLANTANPSQEVSKIVYSIYDWFNENKDSLVANRRCLPPKWIWIETNCKFVSTSECAVNSLGDLDLSPYYYSLSQINQLKNYLSMFFLLGVPQNFENRIVSRVLSDIKRNLNMFGLDSIQLKTVLHILRWIHIHGEQSIKVLIPTDNSQLLPPSDCTYNDVHWDESKLRQNRGYIYVHPEVPLQRAKYFQVVPLSHRIAPSKRIGLKYLQRGPHQSVTGRLKEAIEEYGGDVDVFKELIQNADDAQATEVKFIIDWRQHPCENLLDPDMKHWQGPALLAYNNGVFSKNDLENICELAGGSKKSDPTKIGRFGIGFCSIYHLTDVPSFISGNHFIVFDPHTSYLSGRVTAGEPGMQIDMKEIYKNLDEFKDQFAPYCGLLGFDMTKAQGGYKNTLFRFPFRNDDTARKSKISTTMYDRGRVRLLCDTLKKSAADLLVFLQNVKELSLYELDANSSVSDLKRLLSVTKTVEPIPHFGQTLIEQFRQGYGLESCQKKIFKIECCIGQTKQADQWMVTSCLGTGKSKSISESRTGKANGLCPLGEIAVKLDRSSSFAYPLLADGKLFCFLPLPIPCNLGFYCSGYFEVSKDRRWLKKDASSGKLNEWNSLIISDALYDCFIKTLVNLTNVNKLSSASKSDKEKFLKGYYSLWLNANNVSFVGRLLFHKIKQSIHLTTDHILWSDVDGGKWLSPKEALVYNHHDKVKQDIRDDIIHLLLQHHYHIVDIPYDIKFIMSTSIGVVDYKDYCSKVLIPNIATLPVGIRDSQIIALLLYIESVPDPDWAKKHLRSICCVPTRPNGRLRKPDDLIDPNSSLAKLYFESDECFPTEAYMKVDKVANALQSLGMSCYQLSMDKLKARASTVIDLQYNEAIQRAKRILLYLSQTYITFGYHGFCQTIDDSLRDIPFIPVSKRPQGLLLPWFNSSTTFQSPKKVFSYKHKNLVFTKAPVVMKFDGEDQILVNGLSKLKVETTCPSVDIVAAHLVCLVNHSQQNSYNSLDHELLNECCPAIYRFLYESATSQVQNNPLKLLKGLPFIWQNNRFLTVDQIKFDSTIVDAFPYLCELSDENKKYKDLFIKLGVTVVLGQNRLFSLLESVYCDHNGKALSEEHVRFVISIAEKLSKNSLSLRDHDRVLYLPDENGIMRPASKLAYKENVDLPALQGSEILARHFKEGTFWLHHSFTATLARSLGITSALNSILNEMSSKNFLVGTEYGQCEDLCDRLNSILRKYPHDESIFKEFIQNADDAGASEIVFILDHRNHIAQDGELFSSDPEWRILRQCPSLLVYNSKKMSEDDIIGITKLGRGNKEFSPDLIGRFGIGFNVAYHVTDCPTFVSYGQGVKPENFCILDPGGLFTPGHHQANLRGRRFEMDSLTCQQFSKEFDPFYNSEVFLRMSKMCEGCFSDISTNFCNGCVLFRLPFTRSINPPCDTKLKSGYKMDTRDMQRLFEVLSRNAEDLVLFLNNIKSISAFEIQKDGTCTHHFTTVVSQSSKDAAVCTEHVKQLKVEVKNLKSKLDREASTASSRLQALAGNSQRSNNGVSLDTVNIQYNSYPEVSWGYQLKIQTVTHKIDSSSQKSSMHRSNSVWFISQQFGSKNIPTDVLKAALADGLLPKGGVAVQVYGDVLRPTFSLYCSLPLPQPSHMPVHINGNFWVDDSRKHLEFGASRSSLTDWNCYLTKTVIADALINSLVCCRQFIPDKSTEWYYNIFPTESSSGSDSGNYPFGLYKIVYQKIVQRNLQLLQQDTLSLTGNVTWLPVVGTGHGYFFVTEEGQQILRQLLIEFGVKLSKAPLNIYNRIKMAAVVCNIKYDDALIDPVMYISILKSLNLQQHKETIIKNIIILLKYCLSTNGGCIAIKDAPLLLTYSGNLRQFSTVYGSRYAQLLPHKSDEFIHPDLEKQGFIHKLILYIPMPDVHFISSNLQIQNHAVPVHVDKCLEMHSQIIELWKYLNDFFVNVKPKQYVTNLNMFSNKPIIPASNKTLVPICKAKMVLSPNGGGPVRGIMKLFGYPVLNFSILCESTFPTFASALDGILVHCNNVGDILKCIELNNSSPVLPSSSNIAQYKDDLQLFLNLISTSLYLNTTHSFLCKLPIFEAVTGEMFSIKDLQNTYLIPDGVPLAGLKEVMMNSSLLVLKHLPVYVRVYKALKIQHCDLTQFYLKAVIPYLQTMRTKDIIKHVGFIFLSGIGIHREIIGALKASKFIYVADGNRWCSASAFYDPRVRLFGSFSADRFPPNKFPPQEWCTDNLLEILLSLGLQKDLSWQVLFGMVEDVEQEIKQNATDAIVHQDIYCKSKQLLEFIHDKLPMTQDENASGDTDVDRSVDKALQFCENISQIVFVPVHKEDSSPKKEILVGVQGTKQWTKFSTACFASHCDTTFLIRDTITASFSLTTEQHLYSGALGIEDPPSCETVVKNLLKLSQIARSMIQSSKKQSNAIKHFLKQSFCHHYDYLEEHATPEELGLLQGKECLFVEHLFYSVVSGDCIVKTLAEQLFPYLCRIPQDLAEKPKIISALKICDEPNSCHYARILERIHHQFSASDKKLSENPKYLELASKACNLLVDMLHTEETNHSVPNSFISTRLYLLDKQNELQKASELAYDDVPWYSKRLQGIAAYRYMRPLSQGMQDGVPLPQSLGVKVLSDLVVEELDESVLLPDNHCADERCALQRGQSHGCQFVLSLENLLLSTEFKLGLQRIIYHQKRGIELTKGEISLTEKLCKLEFSCYHKITTVLKQRNGQTIQGSSSEVFSVLCKRPDQKLLLCLAPHCDEKDAVVKELAQNINRHLSCIIHNESHLEAMIKCPSHLDIEAALDKCKVKSYTAADYSVQKLPSVGESITPNITDLLIVLNYSKGESVKYWNEDGKLLLAKVVAVKPKMLANLSDKSLTVCTGEDNDSPKVNTSPIFVSKYLQPSFLDNWLSSEKKVMDCSGLLLYHLENDRDPLIIQKKIMLAFKTLSHHQISIVFKRLFFHLHFYFVKCNKQPKTFKELSVKYFKEQVSLFEPSVQLRPFKKWIDDNFEQIVSLERSVVSDEEGELAELFEDMCIYLSDESNSESDSDIRDEDMTANNPFENRDFLEQDLSTEEVPDKLHYRQQKQNIHYRKVHLQKAANIAGATRSQSRQINTTSQSVRARATLSSGATTFTNAFSQPVIHSTPTTGGLFRTSTGGYRSRRARRIIPTPVSIWDQTTTREAPSTDAPPKTNFKTAFMWLQQAIADFNAAKHFIECTKVMSEEGSASKVSRNSSEMDRPCQFPALICFLSHEVVEKSLKAVYLAKCGSTLTNQCDSNLVALYDQLSAARCWPLTDVRDSVLKVSDHNMRCRYPDHHVPAEAPCVLYTELDARHALSAAQDVFVKTCSVECFKDKLPSQPTMLALLPSTVYLDPNSLPEEWEQQDTDLKLCLLDADMNEEEFTKVANLFFQSLPDSEVRTIERIQNRVLWKKYSAKSKSMYEDSIPCRERTLFHGTRQTNPKEIYEGDSSFDMRHSRDGSWGKGNYFAVNSSLADGYAYRVRDVKKILLARVLTGFSYYSPPQKFMKPPQLSGVGGAGGHVQRRYNSVTGQLGGSTVYITYENDFAYPAYIITYI